MLSKVNRVVIGDDYRRIARRGRRIVAEATVTSVVSPSPAGVSRFGFIITKKVGGAVVRNRLRRQLKAIGRGLIDSGMPCSDVVIRVLPRTVQPDWRTLRDEVSSAVMRGTE